ncbi:hypothetical protein IE077_002795, partial [Cardiosporidium cionae]
MGVIPPGGPNVTKAKHYYELAAAQNRLVAMYNIAVLTIKEIVSVGKLSAEKCLMSYNNFLSVAHFHPEVATLILHSLRAHELGDTTGALLRSMLLSELGHPVGHGNTAYLWSEHETRAQLLLSMLKEQQGLIKESPPKGGNSGDVPTFDKGGPMEDHSRHSSSTRTFDLNLSDEEQSVSVESLTDSRVEESKLHSFDPSVPPAFPLATELDDQPKLGQKLSKKQAQTGVDHSSRTEIQSQSNNRDESFQSLVRKENSDRVMLPVAGYKHRRGSHVPTGRPLWILRLFPSLTRILDYTFSHTRSWISRIGLYEWKPFSFLRQASQQSKLEKNTLPRVPQADYLKPEVFSKLYSDQLLEHLRVSEFLHCWALPEFYFSVVERQQLRTIKRSGMFQTKTLQYENIPTENSFHLSSSQFLGDESGLYATLFNSHHATRDITEEHLDALISAFNKNISNSVQACRFYYSRRFAQQNDWLSLFEVVEIYLNGKAGTFLNATKAFEWIDRAANLGNDNALYEKALMLENGIGIPQNKKKAYEIYWEMVLNKSLPQSAIGSLSLLISSAKWCFMKLHTRLDFIYPFSYLSRKSSIKDSIESFAYPSTRSSKSLFATSHWNMCTAKDSIYSPL